MIPELEIKKLREEQQAGFAALGALIMGRGILGQWVMQDIACQMLGVEPRQIRNIRLHQDRFGKTVGSIRWRKGHGKTVEYHKADIEKYLNRITVS